MMEQEIKGIIPAIAATFSETGEFDFDSYASLAETLIKGGSHGIFLFAIAGEYYKLTETEENRLVRITVDQCHKHGAKSIISVTKHATEVAVAAAKKYEDAGADCLVVLPPFFLKPGASDIVTHLKKVAGAVKIPVIVQYAPDQTGVSIAPDILAGLSKEIENLKYFKIECKPPGAYIRKMMDITDQQARIIIGNAGFQMLEGFKRGAIGVMPGCSMFDIYLQIYNAIIAENWQKATRIHNDLNAMLNHIRQNVEMIIHFEKQILKKRGLIANDYCRLPAFKSDAVYDRLFEQYYELISQHFTI